MLEPCSRNRSTTSSGIASAKGELRSVRLPRTPLATKDLVPAERTLDSVASKTAQEPRLMNRAQDACPIALPGDLLNLHRHGNGRKRLGERLGELFTSNCNLQLLAHKQVNMNGTRERCAQ